MYRELCSRNPISPDPLCPILQVKTQVHSDLLLEWLEVRSVQEWVTLSPELKQQRGTRVGNWLQLLEGMLYLNQYPGGVVELAKVVDRLESDLATRAQWQQYALQQA